MKSNLGKNLALNLAPNDNCFTEELIDISWIEFKLSISNWKRFECYFPLLKPKKRARFLLPFRQSKWKYESMKPNLSQKAMKLAPNDSYMTIFVSFTSYIYINTIFKVTNKLEEKNIFYYKCASFVPSNAGDDHMIM